MKKPTKAVSLQIPLFTMEYIKHTVCRKGLLSIPQEKKIKEVFTFFRSDPWQGHRRVR